MAGATYPPSGGLRLQPSVISESYTRKLRLLAAPPTIRFGAGMQCLVVTHDSPIEEVFRRVLAEMAATVEFRGDAKSGLAALEERRFDLVAVDCDDVYQGTGLLRAAHASRPNK